MKGFQFRLAYYNRSYLNVEDIHKIHKFGDQNCKCRENHKILVFQNWK